MSNAWDKPKWGTESWHRYVPEYVREIWSQLLPTHKERLMRWADSLQDDAWEAAEAAERDD